MCLQHIYLPVYISIGISGLAQYKNTSLYNTKQLITFKKIGRIVCRVVLLDCYSFRLVCIINWQLSLNNGLF